MKLILPGPLLLAGAGLIPAAIVETITFDLGVLHAGSTLSGTFSLSNSPNPGDTATAALSFTDPADYSPTSLSTTITILSATPSGLAVDFSPLTFTNLSGVVTPINTRDVSLMRLAFANCASFPCTTSGLFQDRSPAVFQAAYSIAPAAVPEPGYTLAVPIVLTAIVFGRRFARPNRR
jgi:hypothetical protein